MTILSRIFLVLSGYLEKESEMINWLENFKYALDNVRCKKNGVDSSFLKTAQKTKALFKKAEKRKASIFWVANGGSAAICSHLSQDMVNKLGIKSYHFNDSSLITCMANDYGYENVYARPLKVHASKNDILIAISSSGNSKNILNAVKVAKKKNMKVITLSGLNENNKLWATPCLVSFFVSSDFYGIVEVCHETILHSIIETLKRGG